MSDWVTETELVEARRLLGELIERGPSSATYNGRATCIGCMADLIQGEPHADDCGWVAAKNFLESKP